MDRGGARAPRGPRPPRALTRASSQRASRLRPAGQAAARSAIEPGSRLAAPPSPKSRQRRARKRLTVATHRPVARTARRKGCARIGPANGPVPRCPPLFGGGGRRRQHLAHLAGQRLALELIADQVDAVVGTPVEHDVHRAGLHAARRSHAEGDRRLVHVKPDEGNALSHGPSPVLRQGAGPPGATLGDPARFEAGHPASDGHLV
jgi:hypothetical protein